MEENSTQIIECQTMYVDKDLAWGCGQKCNALFQFDLKEDSVEYLTDFPDYSIGGVWRKRGCLRHNDDIWCFPIFGEDIWVFHLAGRELKKIDITNPQKKQLIVLDFFFYEGAVFVISCGLVQILKINANTYQVEKVWDLEQECHINVLDGKSILVGNRIYMLSCGCIYEFLIPAGTLKKYQIADAEEGLFTICDDGNSFWLSGKSRALYRWDRETGKIEKRSDFPDDMGIWQFSEMGQASLDVTSEIYQNVLFDSAVFVKDKIWFIPCQANKIIYIEKDTGLLKSYEMENEEETDATWCRTDRYKYWLVYVREDRFIGLFSAKNQYLVEIDTELMQTNRRRFRIKDEKALWKRYLDGKVSISERNPQGLSEFLFRVCHMENSEADEQNQGTVGKEIYQCILRGD